MATIAELGLTKLLWVTIRTDAIAGDGQISDPLDGSTQAKLDAILTALAEGVCLRLGPGEFQTNGNLSNTVSGWKPKNSQKFIGCGIGVTTLKLASVNGAGTYNDKLLYLIGVKSYSDRFVDILVADMTIDSNQANNLNTSCSGVGLYGNRNILRNLRFINWGNDNSIAESFVASLGGGHPNIETNGAIGGQFNLMDSCVFDTPYESTGPGGALIMHIGSASEQPNTGIQTFNAWNEIRNCTLDCRFTDGSYPTFDVRGSALGAGLVNVFRGNRIIGASSAGPYHDTYSSKSMLITGNHYYHCGKGPHMNLGGISNYNDGSALAQTHHNIASAIRNPSVTNQCIITTSEPHGVFKGCRINLAGFTGTQATKMNGVRVVWNYISPTQFEVISNGVLTGDPTFATAYMTFEGIGRTLNQIEFTDTEAVVTTSTDHGLEVGDQILVFGVKDPNESPMNRWAKVTWIDSANQFTFDLASAPNALTHDLTYARYGKLWVVDKLVIEGNYMRMEKTVPTAGDVPLGIKIYANLLPNEAHVFNEVIIRNNVIVSEGGHLDPIDYARAISITNARRIICMNNVIDVGAGGDEKQIIEIYRRPAGQIEGYTFFNNKTLDGESVLAYDVENETFISDVDSSSPGGGGSTAELETYVSELRLAIDNNLPLPRIHELPTQ